MMMPERLEMETLPQEVQQKVEGKKTFWQKYNGLFKQVQTDIKNGTNMMFLLRYFDGTLFLTSYFCNYCIGS